jgi:hypothetical protein
MKEESIGFILHPSSFILPDNLALTRPPVVAMPSAAAKDRSDGGAEANWRGEVMGSRRLARCLVYPALLLAAGCLSMHHYRPVAVTVQDAETKQPVAGANVRIWYPMALEGLAPYDSSGTTGADGIARLRAAPYKDSGFLVETTAKGYLFEELSLPPELVRPPAKGDDPGDVRVVVELFAEPSPAIELVVPAGYRGVVKADVQIQADAVYPPGQRVFRYEVSASGAVVVNGPPLLRRVTPAGFRARYVDGSALGQPTDGTVGFRWLRHDGDVHFFVVGTQLEYNSIRGSEEEESRPRGGGKGESRGGGHHRRDNSSSAQ